MSKDEYKKWLLHYYQSAVNKSVLNNWITKKIEEVYPNGKPGQKIFWSTPLDPGVWDTSAFTPKTPDVFSLPPIPPQNPSTVAETMKQEWNL